MRVIAWFTAAVMLTACTGNPGTPAEVGNARLVVFAAASLNGAFSEVGREFEAAHPGVRITFSFDGSAALVDQLKQGAPADVFAAADRPTMAKATAAGLIAGTPEQFTSNLLTLVVPTGNPAHITGLDSSLDGKKLVTCADEVPCGSATAKLATLVGVILHPVSEETKVTDVRAKVESGQADAGVVYVTDALASGDLVESVAIQRADQVRNDYLIAVTGSASAPGLADEFVAAVKGSRGQAVLAAAGFGP
ncbi:MAG: molybdate ABC transporter substrate-binding protein [Propionicimonas sp.]